LKLFEISTGLLLAHLEIPGPSPRFFAFDPDGTSIVGVMQSLHVMEWEVATGRLLKDVPWDVTSRRESFEAIISQNSRIVATVVDPIWITLVDIKAGSIIKTFKSNTHSVLSVALSPNGKVLATRSLSGHIHLWDARTGNSRQQLEDSCQDPIIKLVFQEETSLLATVGERILQLWDTATNALWVTIADMDASNMEQRVLDRATRYHTMSQSLKSQIELFVNTIKAAMSHQVLSPTGSLLESQCPSRREGIIELKDVQSGLILGTLDAHIDLVTEMIISPDNDLLASTSHDETTRVWGSSLLSASRSSGWHSAKVREIILRPENNLVLSADAVGNLKAWDMATGEAGWTLQIAHKDVWQTPLQDYSVLMTTEAHTETQQPGLISLWDPLDGQSLGHFQYDYRASPYETASTPDRTLLALALGTGLRRHHSLGSMRDNYIESSRSGPWYRDIRSESAVHYQERVAALLKRLNNYLDDEVLTGHPIIKALFTLLDRIETVLSNSGFAINDAEEKTTSSIASHMRGVLFKLEELNKWKPGLIQVLEISTRSVRSESKDHLDYVQFLSF
jgi:WD40 repeat protein